MPIFFYCTPGTYPATCPTSDTYQFNPNDPAPKVAYTTWFKTNAQLPAYLNNLVRNPELNPWVMTGDEIQLVNGQVQGAMHEVYQQWIANARSWTVFLPVVDATYGQNSGGNEERVLGMIPMTITDVVDPGNQQNGNGNGPPETFTLVRDQGTAFLESCICAVPIPVR